MSNTTPTPKKYSLWNVELKAFAVERYMETKSFHVTIRDVVTKFNPIKTPYKSLIVKWVAKFRKEGTVRNLNSRNPSRNSHSGRKRKRDEVFIDRLRESVQESPHKSTRRCQELASTRSTMLRAINEDLKLFPYRITIHQKLTEAAKMNRLDMAKVLVDKIEKTKNFLQLLWTSDEAHCYLEGAVNSKNSIYWGSQRPNEVITKPLHSKKVTVWCAVSEKGIIGPYFFEENGMTTSINSERYFVMLERFLEDLKRLFPSNWQKMWFQQDGASPHAAQKSLDWLRVHFKSRIISRKWRSSGPLIRPT
ncbi:hypothetical protein LOD99_10776 [Oopsacas minuta]|uniref:DUF4817 domain-containing protein n=1 Tax=Oopsacas minuta TaxID=111878 RepID=A0AAV7KEZ5_9METZ|nr:hypothetical protein LOD99_10776 [Oopsacas minuta]